MKISEIISKEVISIYECESVGTVKNVQFSKNLKKVIGFVFFNDETDYESFIPNYKVYKTSNEGVLIKNTSMIEFFVDEQNNPINKKVFSITGRDCGRIIDLYFDENNNVEYLYTSKHDKILPEQILSNGVNIMLVREENQKVSMSSFKPKEEKFEEINQNLQVKIVKMPTINDFDTNILPQKISASPTSIVGKRSKKTIMGLNNEIIVKQNQVISQYVLNMAKKHNKTNELVFSVFE